VTTRARTLAPRVVVVTRPTEYELLIARHATRAQAVFFLESRGGTIDAVEARHHTFEEALHAVMTAIPRSWRRTRVQRDELAAFRFDPEDTVVVVGQDGLVANVAKYLDGQPVLGVNPDPNAYDGVLVPLPPIALTDLLVPAAERRADVESRTMVAATLDDGQVLVALNEIFVGHATHQSARYRIDHGERTEAQSSSGVVITTGTGATGWASSIVRRRITDCMLPAPAEPRLSFFVREAFESRTTGVEVVDGDLRQGEHIELVSQMNDGGVIFGDGIERDRLRFDWGMRVSVSIASQRLALVHG
jgi:NAD kinase